VKLSTMVEESQKTLSTIVKHMFNSEKREDSSFANNIESQTDTVAACRSQEAPMGGAANLPSTSSEPSTNSPEGRFISQLALTTIYQGSCSRKNFSVNLVRRLLDERTRRSSNVSGKGGKTPLNPDIMQYVRSCTMQFYPLQGYENSKKEWAACVVAIDESCRRLVNKPRKLILQSA